MISRLLFILPNWIVPTVLLLVGFYVPASRVAWWGYWALQLLYLCVVEGARRVGTLSPSATFERGNAAATRCVVLVHGFADTPLAWSRQADALAARGWRVIVPELDLTQTATQWQTVIREALIEARRTASWVELWGHSMGGALSMAVAQTEVVDRLVLWAPFLEPAMGNLASRTLYWLHRLFFLWPYTLTWFPVERRGKGEPETFYRVRRVIPTRTFQAALAVPQLALVKRAPVPTCLILSQNDRVVRNAPVLNYLSDVPVLWAANPRSSHALTNAVDWLENLKRVLGETDDLRHSL